MSRKPTVAELERRLRLEADRGPALSPSFRPRLLQRLAATAPEGRRALRRRAAPHPMTWCAGVAAAAALLVIVGVVGVLAMRPAPHRGQAEVAAALGAVVQNALARRPEAIASAGEQRLAEEARRLLADARQATSPLLSPWRSAR